MYYPSLLDHVNLVGKGGRFFLVATVNEEEKLVGLVEAGGGREVYRDVPFSDTSPTRKAFEMERIWRILGGPARGISYWTLNNEKRSLGFSGEGLGPTSRYRSKQW